MAKSYTTTQVTNANSKRSMLFKTWFAPAFLALAVLLYQADPFDPAPYPETKLTQKHTKVPLKVNNRLLERAEFVGFGQMLGPEDLAYEPRSRFIYCGCADGWIKRVKVGESVVEDWVNTGGRPLGIAIHTTRDELIVADANKGLLKISKNKEIELLTDEAEGKKFKLTDGVDIAKDDTIYFTDASSKYGFDNCLDDLLEMRPYGRLLSFNPITKQTKVLLQDLYFPNGVAISPDQNAVIFCETFLKRCRKYWIQGNRKGVVDTFIENLPGFPDNIHSGGENNYLIGMSSWMNPYLEPARRYRLVRKAMMMMDRYIGLHYLQRNGGILAVDLEGNPSFHVYDPQMSMISSGITIEDHLYIGSLYRTHIIHFNLTFL